MELDNVTGISRRDVKLPHRGNFTPFYFSLLPIRYLWQTVAAQNKKALLKTPATLLLAIVVSLLAPINSFAEEVEWIVGGLPEGAVAEGEWHWDKDLLQDGTATHTNSSSEIREIRSFKVNTEIPLTEDTKITQYIFLDEKESPLGIMLKLHIGELEDPISIYWEGDEEIFADLNEYITAWYMDILPEPGGWIRLEIDCNELELAETHLNGMSFITHGGKCWFGKTIIGETNVKEKT